jgi:hypothetical protein
VDAKSVMDILPEAFEKSCATRLTTVFFHLLVSAKREASAPSRFFSGHACPGVFFHLLLEVEAKFWSNSASITSRRNSARRRNRRSFNMVEPQPHALSKIWVTAAVSFRQESVSTSSCFLPVGVSS